MIDDAVNFLDCTLTSKGQFKLVQFEAISTQFLALDIVAQGSRMPNAIITRLVNRAGGLSPLLKEIEGPQLHG